MENQEPLDQGIAATDEAQPNFSKQEITVLKRMIEGKPYGTYVLMGLNILVFIVMVISGVSPFKPESLDLINFGATVNIEPFDTEYWRYFTAIFIHIGLFHIAMNMFALYQANIIENLIGTRFFLISYLIAGLCGSAASMLFHSKPVISAGASGAIFGMYGLFLAFLLTDIIPIVVRNSMLKSIGTFVVLNLMFGLQGGIDNAAHVGGLVSGFLMGFVIQIFVKKDILKDMDVMG